MKTFTLATPRYCVEDSQETQLDVFRKKKNAIKSAIKLAAEYPRTTFMVVRKSLHTRKVIFSFCINAQMNFDDVSDVYLSIVEVYQKKFDKTRFWRKPDELDRVQNADSRKSNK